MKRKLLQRLLVGVAGCSMVGVAAALWWTVEYADPPDGRPVTLREVLGWLPLDTETVICAGGPFALAKEGFEEGNLENGARALAASIAPEIASGALFGSLAGRNVSLCVEGSRAFQSPNGLGFGPFEGATVLLFEEPLEVDGGAFMNAVMLGASGSKIMAWRRVVVRKEKWESDNWTIFVAHPWKNVIVVATHEEYLREILTRMRAGVGRRQLPEHIEEALKRVGGSRYWAARRYDPVRAAEDPTSPLAPGQAAANEPDPEAKGLLFAYDPTRSKEAIVTYLSGNERAVEIARKYWSHPSEKFTPLIRAAGQGAVEIVVSDSDSASGRRMFFFVLLAALGHPVFV